MHISLIETIDVRDVCMDEAAVSSDPVVAFLLDEVVVKDWCKRAFKNIIAELKRICILTDLVNILNQCLSISVLCLFVFYAVFHFFHFLCALTFSLDNIGVEEMKTRLSLLLKFQVQLAGISSVIEVLASSFKDDLSAQIHDLQHLQESILKTKQVAYKFCVCGLYIYVLLL